MRIFRLGKMNQTPRFAAPAAGGGYTGQPLPCRERAGESPESQDPPDSLPELEYVPFEEMEWPDPDILDPEYIDYAEDPEPEARTWRYWDDRQLPPELRALRAFTSSVWIDTRAKVFWQQALLAKDYEDDFDGEPGYLYAEKYPTYSSLNNVQLRAYFAWRTRIRHDDVEFGDPVFQRIYAFETINGIFPGDPKNGLALFKEVAAMADFGYRPVRRAQVKIWLRDFAVYYGISPEETGLFDEDVSADLAVLALRTGSGASDQEIFSAMNALAAKSPEKSKSYPGHEDLFTAVFAACWRSLLEADPALPDRLFGRVREIPYAMFRDAVFYDSMREPREYAVNPIRIYRRDRDRWYLKALYPPGLALHNKTFGEILHEIERQARQSFGFGRPLKPKLKKAKWQEAVTAGIHAYLLAREKAEREARMPKIDLSRLGRIRSDAEVTRDSLLEGIEEELEKEYGETVSPDADLAAPPAESVSAPGPQPAAPASPAPAPASAPPTAAPEENGELADLGLTPDETEFLRLTVLDGSAGEWARQRHLFPSVLADSINEKIFDLLGDTALVDDGSGIAPLEDYLDDLKDLLGI